MSGLGGSLANHNFASNIPSSSDREAWDNLVSSYNSSGPATVVTKLFPFMSLLSISFPFPNRSFIDLISKLISLILV